LDEALSLAVSARGVRLGAQVADAELLAGSFEVGGAIGGAVVGHDPLDAYAAAAVVLDGGAEQRGGGIAVFIGGDIGEGDA